VENLRSARTASTAPAADPAAVTNDTPCRKCGYNLRGLAVNGRCPECGTPVGVAIHGELLRYSEPRWVQTLARGVRLIVAGLAVIALGVFAMMGVAVAGAAAGSPGVFVALVAVVAMLGYGLMVVGSWLLTTPDPSGIGEDRYGTARKVIRASLIIGAGNVATSFFQADAAIPPAARVVLDVFAFAAAVFGAVAIFAQLSYLSKLAARIPEPELSARAHFLMYALGISFSIFIVLQWLQAFLGPRPGAPGAPRPLMCFTGIAGLMVMGFGLWSLLVLERMGRLFKEQAALARRIWGKMRNASGAAATG
jgi:hypothetical protein